MVAFVSALLAVSVVAGGSYVFGWWMPIIAFPLCVLMLPKRYAYRHPSPHVSIQTMRWFFYLLCATYVTAQTVVFHIQIGSWYGWLVGFALSWIVAATVAAKLDDSLRWK